MKKSLLYTICLMALAISVLPVSANDYLKIYFKDGHTERHYMKLVESISASKYDLEGILHDDYQIQQIVMKDTTYSYYIADIDSMSFRKVNEEEVKKDVETIAKTVTPIFEQCSTVEEMEEHIDEIINTEGVEDAWRSGTEIVVKVRDWYDMVFMYPAIPEDESSSLARKIESINAQNIKRQIQQVKEDGTKIKVAIAFQMVNDTRKSYIDSGNYLRKLRDKFEEMGFEAVFIPSKEGGNFDLDFYRRRLFDYDIVILDTHGYYEERNGQHGFLTDEYLGISTPQVKFWNWVDEHLDKYGLYGIDPVTIDIEDAFIGCCHTGAGISSGVFIGVYENFISKCDKYKFAKGPHIVFNGACSSLESNHSVADVFFRKGADIYLGYDNSCSLSSYAADKYFQAMLGGYSHEAAFNSIPYDFKYEKKWDSSLIDVISRSKNDNPKGVFIVNTHTLEKTEKERNEEFEKNKEIELEGITSCYDLGYDTGCYIVISTEPNVDEKNGENIQCHNAHYTGNCAKEVFFSAKYSPEPGKKYYYRACTWDGFHRNWGEERSFEIDKVKNLAVGDVFTVDDVVYKVTSISPLEVQIGNQEDCAIDRRRAGAFEIPSTVKGTDGYTYSVTSIGDFAFLGCKSLISVDIPISVTTIGFGAFRYCYSLTSVKIGSNVKSIGDYAFCYCDGLKSIVIPNSVTSIGNYAFNDIKGLISVTISQSVTSIGNYAFGGCSSLSSIDIPNSVTYIGVNAFEKCKSLTIVTIGNKVTSIGERAFQECTGLTTVVLGTSVTSIGDYAFFGCNSLTSVNIPSSVTTIGTAAFESCSSLTSLKIPKSVTSIGYGPFRYCSSLAKIYADATTPLEVDYWLFEGVDVDNCVLYVPKGCVNKYRWATGWGAFKNIVEMN